jgi:hypothetical protein
MIHSLIFVFSTEYIGKKYHNLSIRDLENTIFRSHRASLYQFLMEEMVNGKKKLKDIGSGKDEDVTQESDPLYSMELTCAEIAARTMLYSRNPHLIQLMKGKFFLLM